MSNYKELLTKYGFGYLLTKQSASTKLNKNVSKSDNYLSWIMYLEPDKDLCPAATANCMATCLRWSGRLAMSKTPTKRSIAFKSDRELFIHRLVFEVDKAVAHARKRGKIATFRFNGTSDVDWKREIREYYPYFYEEREDCVFYEYTKRPSLLFSPSPIRFTFSRSDVNEKIARKALAVGQNVAIVFGKELPDIWMGYRVIDGDKHDMRFLDPKGVVVGLRAKGKARKADNKFILRNIS